MQFLYRLISYILILHIGMNTKKSCFWFKMIEGNVVTSNNFVNKTFLPKNDHIMTQPVDILKIQKEKDLKLILQTQALTQNDFGAESNDHSSSTPTKNENCSLFEDGIDNMFMSPKYPENYPDNINCVKQITADEGMAVVVKFIEHFEIEKSEVSNNCDYDYLQIRNGQFGYSPLSATICGTNPPIKIASTGRHLWLRFHSDESINYKGFKAIFEFVPAPKSVDDTENCTFTLGGYDGEIDSESEIDEALINNAANLDKQLDCTWEIRAPVGSKIFLKMPVYKLEVPNRCSEYAIEIYKSSDELRGVKGEPKKLCGSQAESVKSDDHILAIRLIAKVNKAKDKEKTKISQFQANYTVFREVTSGVSCNEDEFDCTDNTCVSNSLVCNGKVNCLLRADEDSCPDLKPEGLKADILLIAFLGCLLVAGMCGGLVLNVYRKLSQDKQELSELREQLRKSRESGFQSERHSVGESLEPSQNKIVTLNVEDPSSQESGESKDTVIEKPNYAPSAPNATPSVSQEKPNGDVLNKKLKVVNVDVTPQPTSGRGIVTYSPPMAYRSKPPPSPLKPTIMKPRRASGSDIVLSSNLQSPAYPQSVVLYEKPSSVQLVESSTDPLKSLESSTEQLQCIEVRDCACQTRDSFLSRLRSQQHLAFSTKFLRRAPLARGEALEMQDISQPMPVRRINRAPKTPGDYLPYHPYTYAASSASSETGRSLERLDELQDE